MLTRLRATGFKNLLDADVSFGPFTCIAGANGVGKSNLFDAITFLSDLTQFSIVEAAARVRDPIAKSGDIRALFYRDKNGPQDQMSFEAEFLVPDKVVDDFGRPAEPSITFLKYRIVLRYRAGSITSPDRIELAAEELSHINIGDAPKHLLFKHDPIVFRNSVVKGQRRVRDQKGGTFISSAKDEEGRTIIELRGDKRAGRASQILAEASPRTVVGATNTDSHPTVLAARREMQSWKLLQLEPSALRQPDEFNADPHVASNGAHLPATLLRLGDEARAVVTNRLAALLPDIREVKVDADEKRRLITLFGEERDRVPHPARSLSDGTLRFLALAVIGTDPEAGGLICLEEPENGIHPLRIPAMVDLLQSLAVDPEETVGLANPLRQVIVNTHSPLTVGEVDQDSLVVAVPYQMPDSAGGSTIVKYEFLPETWRCEANPDARTISMGELRAYLEGETQEAPQAEVKVLVPKRKRVRDVVEEQKKQLTLFEEEAA